MDKGIWNKLDDVYEVLKALRASYPNRIKIIKDLLDEALFRPIRIEGLIGSIPLIGEKGVLFCSFVYGGIHIRVAVFSML